MKLNRLERHTAYIIMLAEAELQDFEMCRYGFCRMMSRLFGFDKDLDSGVNYLSQVELFPELNNKKLLAHGELLGGWFDYDDKGWQKRIELLKQCIKETY